MESSQFANYLPWNLVLLQTAGMSSLILQTSTELCHLQWMICHLVVFKCTLFAYPTQSACLGSTLLYLYSALFCIQGYFLPSVLLTGSGTENKKNISYSVQEQQGGWLLFSTLLPFCLSCGCCHFGWAQGLLQKRTVHGNADGEGRGALVYSECGICSRASPQCPPPPSPREAGHGHRDDSLTQLRCSWQAHGNKFWAGNPIIPGTSHGGFPQPADPASSMRKMEFIIHHLSWLLCQWHPNPPLQLAWPLVLMLCTYVLLLLVLCTQSTLSND